MSVALKAETSLTAHFGLAGVVLAGDVALSLTGAFRLVVPPGDLLRGSGPAGSAGGGVVFPSTDGVAFPATETNGSLNCFSLPAKYNVAQKAM